MKRNILLVSLLAFLLIAAAAYAADDASLRVKRGNELTIANDLDGAKREYSAAIGLDPKSFDAHYFLGHVYLKKGEFAEARKSFEEAVKLNPKSGEAQYNLACALARDNQVELALQALKKAISINQDKFLPFAEKDPDFAALKSNPGFAALLKSSSTRF